MSKITLIGSQGFISKNFLSQQIVNEFDICEINRKNLKKNIKFLNETDFLLHFAGTNRSSKKKDFVNSNINLIELIKKNIGNNNKIKIIYLSTNKLNQNSIYGKTKKRGEKLLVDFCKNNNLSLYVYRIPNIFGKWSKPYYNSVVSTFCYCIMNGRKYSNDNPQKKISLTFVGDLMNSINQIIYKKKHLKKIMFVNNYTKYKCSLKDLENKIKSFKDFRKSKNFDIFRSNFDRKLYSTYISYCNQNNFYYPIDEHKDQRGSFIEFLKHKNIGQISYLTIKPNKIRGCHFHHYKTEKFLIHSGKFQVTYFDISDKKKKFTKKFNNKKSYVLETIPGYYHEIKNIGKQEISVLVWANEIFDKLKPDTFSIDEKI